MNDKFLDAMTQQSLLMMKKACAGESLSKEEINFILLTQKLSERNEKRQILPLLVNNSQKIFPLITSLVLNKDVSQRQDEEDKERLNE